MAPDEKLQRTVFPVARVPIGDPNEPPTCGEEYLRRVRLESGSGSKRFNVGCSKASVQARPQNNRGRARAFKPLHVPKQAYEYVRNMVFAVSPEHKHHGAAFRAIGRVVPARPSDPAAKIVQQCRRLFCMLACVDSEVTTREEVYLIRAHAIASLAALEAHEAKAAAEKKSGNANTLPGFASSTLCDMRRAVIVLVTVISAVFNQKDLCVLSPDVNAP